jgi:hypothetical protein
MRFPETRIERSGKKAEPAGVEPTTPAHVNISIEPKTNGLRMGNSDL